LEVSVEFEHADLIAEDIVPTPDRVIQGPNGVINPLAINPVTAVHDPSKEATVELDIDVSS
jgi:hypothetical protein